MTNLLELPGKKRHIEQQEIVALPAVDSLPPAFWTSYSALANALGGVIVLGAKIDQTACRIVIQGLKAPGKILAEIYEGLEKGDKVSANILFDDRINQIEYEGVHLVLVDIPRADRSVRPVCAGPDLYSGCYRRDKGRNRLCTREEIQSMLREQDSRTDSRLLETLTISALETASIRRYRLIFSAKRPEHPWNDLGDEEFLVRAGACGYTQRWDRHPTVAGLLFFGKREELRQTFPKYVLDYREILPGGSWLNRVSSRDPDWSGNVFDFYCRAIDSLTGAVPAPGWMDSSRGRTFKAEAGGCIGELYANALIHADYYGGGGIVADQAESYIRIANPGTFQVDPWDAAAGGVTRYRNETLAGLFHLIGVGTGVGEGLHRVMKTWERYQLPTVEITEHILMNRVSVTARLKKEKEETAKAASSEIKPEKKTEKHQAPEEVG